MGATPPDDLSYDPRAWVVAPARMPPSAAAPKPKPTRRPMPLALPAGLAIAATGALFAWSARPAAPPPVAPAQPAPAAPAEPGSETRTLVLSGPEDLPATLATLGIAPADTAAALRAIGPALRDAAGELRVAATLRPAAGGARLSRLTIARGDGSGVEVAARAPGDFTATSRAAKLVRRLAFVRGELDGQSFYSSAVAAGVNDMLVGEFANAFRYDFDMQREVAKGDVFEAGFEQPTDAAGDPVGAPVLVYAALSTAAKSRALYRYRPANGAAEWVDAGGRSSRRALMRTPVEAARISSGFGMRGHPILGFVKMHRGTDFAAPTGTPIFAAGDATVSFAGPKGANGNFVRLHHDNGWDTLYLHMNRIAAGLAPGMRVVQGQQIGEVGTTGRSTGPHLHYEVHIAGAPVDPLSIDTAGGRTLTGATLAAFRRQRDRIDAGRAASAT